jgi:hypothetical protein
MITVRDIVILRVEVIGWHRQPEVLEVPFYVSDRDLDCLTIGSNTAFETYLSDDFRVLSRTQECLMVI